VGALNVRTAGKFAAVRSILAPHRPIRNKKFKENASAIFTAFSLDRDGPEHEHQVCP
jgi:hypothetical protein